MKLIKEVKENKLLSNTVWSLGAKIAAMIFYFVADAYYARSLGVEQYAEWVFFYAIATMGFYIGWFGINPSSKVHIALSSEKGICFGAAFRVRFLFSIGISSFLFFLAPNMVGYFKQLDTYIHLKRLMYILAGMVFFNSFSDFFKHIYIGIQDYRKLFLLTLLEYLSYFLFSLVLLARRLSVESIAWGYCIAGVCLFVINLAMINNKFSVELMLKGRKDVGLQRKIIKYAIPLILTTIGGLVLTEMDTFMLGAMSTKEQVSIYSIAKQICSKSTHINMAIWTGTVATLAAITKDNYVEKRKQFQKINCVNRGISIVICVLFLIFGRAVVKTVYGEQYIFAGNIMCILIPYQFLYCVSSFHANFLDFIGRARRRAIWYLSVIVINLIMNWLLIPLWGAIGAAIATSLSLLPYTIYCLVDVKRVFKTLKIDYEIQAKRKKN